MRYNTRMAESPATSGPDRFVVLCLRCERRVLARDEWIGTDVRCPHCDAIMRVPPRALDNRPVLAGAPSVAPRRNFTFPCARCGCLLEGHTGITGREAGCPTCGARFLVPGVNTVTGMPDAATLLHVEPADPVPVHLYGGAGHQAPQFQRRADGELEIECPRCRARCPVESDACAACGAPFTLEGAPTIDKLRGDSRATAALVCGIVAVFGGFLLILPPLLAIGLALMSLLTVGPSGSRQGAGIVARAIIGLVLGLLGAALAALFYGF